MMESDTFHSFRNVSHAIRGHPKTVNKCVPIRDLMYACHKKPEEKREVDCVAELDAVGNQDVTKVLRCDIWQDSQVLSTQLNDFITTVEVNRFISFAFAFQFTSIHGTDGTIYKMSAFGKVEAHLQ